MEVSARPVPRLFPRTLYGTSFWARFLFEHCACFRPLHRVAAWFSSQGLPVSPGTLADSLKRFVPLFEPLAAAILAHQNKAVLRHADETGWRVQELRGEDRSSRAWLWASVSSDAVYFHIDPSRSAEAAGKGCVSKVVEIGFGASPSGLSFAAVRPLGQGFRRRLADRGFPIHRLCASGFGRKRGAPRGASALFRDTAARSVF